MLFLLPLVLVFILCYVSYRNGTYYEVTKTPFLDVAEIPFSPFGRDKGKEGEYLIYKNLKYMEANGARFLFNLYIPKKGGETTEIDVLMLCSKGIFVFESKNYGGWIFGNESQTYWYQTFPKGRGRSQKEQFYNPIRQNRTHIKHLKNIIGTPFPVYSVIVFSDRCTLKSLELESDDTIITYQRDLNRSISSICNQASDTVLDSEWLDCVYSILYPYTQVSEQTKAHHASQAQSHTFESTRSRESHFSGWHQEKAFYSASSPNTPICPQCGAFLEVRTAKNGRNAGSRFWGCSAFPKCRYTRNL